MTGDEIDEERKRAEALAKSIGGALAVLLGLKTASRPVAWDAARGRFVIDGRFVSVETVRRELRRLETGVGARMSNVTDRLASGNITLDGWRNEIKELIGSSHVLTGALAAGSVAAAAVLPVVQQRIESERKFADRFVKDIPARKLKTPAIKARARSYLLAAGVTFSVVEQRVRSILGYTMARRVTTARESCDGCRAAAYQWIPIGEMPEIGSLQCGSRCRCHLEYK